jgi:putative addiction module antidote
MTTVELTTIGKSMGVILPDELLEKLHIGKGDRLYVVETPEGIELTPCRDFAAQMEVAEDIMRNNRDVLRKLAQ